MSSYVNSYFRRDGTYVSGHIRNRGISNNSFIPCGSSDLAPKLVYLKELVGNKNPFEKNSKYKEIDQQIKENIKDYLDELKLLDDRYKRVATYIFIDELQNFIEKKLENKILEIPNIFEYYNSFNDITAIRLTTETANDYYRQLI